LRRVRRGDEPSLLGCVGGPSVARTRALKRIARTLAADLYVVDRGDRLVGVVAITYQRSLAAGGLVATVDTLRLLGSDLDPVEADGYRNLLVDCALERARKRGCVSIEVAPSQDGIGELLSVRGFAPADLRFTASLREANSGSQATRSVETGREP